MKKIFLLTSCFLSLFGVMNGGTFTEDAADESIDLESFSRRQLIEKIKANYTSCIKEQIGHKIYLHPEYLHSTPKGIFLQDGDAFLPLSNLLSDGHGSYLLDITDPKVEEVMQCLGYGDTRSEKVDGKFDDLEEEEDPDYLEYKK